MAERCATYALLDGVLFELSNISHVNNIGQATAQHLSCDSMFVASDRMRRTKYLLRGKVSASFSTPNLEKKLMLSVRIKGLEIKTEVNMLRPVHTMQFVS